jgi:glycosyltransferase involved in cell wall biosynthesis
VRVLHVCAYYAPAFAYGGPPRSVHGLCRALRRHGVDARVVTTDANGDGVLPSALTSAGEFEGVPVTYFPRTWPSEPIGSTLLTRALRSAVRRFDLVHIHGLWNRVVWAAAREAARAGVPYVLSPRGMLEDAALAHRRWRKRLAYAAIERHTIDGAALLHATSDREEATLRASRPESGVVRIPNGVDVPVLAAGAAGERPPTIAFVGRLHAIKRLDLLLDAFDRVVRLRPDARLVVAGPDEQGLQDALSRRHPEHRASIEWLGEVDGGARDALLARARALVLCSDSESFGMSVVEAMAAATPVVVTTTCGWADLPAHGAGVRVEQSPDAIASALVRLLDEGALASSLGRRGRAWVEESFTCDAVAAAFDAAYRQVLVTCSRNPSAVALS